MGAGTAKGPGKGGSSVKMVRQYEQHEERPRGRKPLWKKIRDRLTKGIAMKSRELWCRREDHREEPCSGSHM